MRLLAVGLLVAAAWAEPRTADDWFEVGLDYLGKGFYREARLAFGESLDRAPGEPVPLAILGVTCAAEGRPAAEAEILLRLAYRRLPEGRLLRFDLGDLLPSRRALLLLERDYRRRVERAERGMRGAPLSVLAFLQVHDGEPADAPALDRMLRDAPADPYAAALARLRARRPRSGSDSPPTTPPTSSAPSAARSGSSSGRS